MPAILSVCAPSAVTWHMVQLGVAFAVQILGLEVPIPCAFASCMAASAAVAVSALGSSFLTSAQARVLASAHEF